MVRLYYRVGICYFSFLYGWGSKEKGDKARYIEYVILDYYLGILSFARGYIGGNDIDYINIQRV